MNRAFGGLLAALFAGGVAAAPVRVLLPAYVEGELGRSPSFTALLLALQLGFGGAFALASGPLADRISRRGAVLVGLTAAPFAACLFAVREPAILIGMAIAWGIAGGFQSAGGQSFLLASVPRAKLGSASAVYFVSATASGALGAYAGGELAEYLGYGTVAALSALCGLASIALAAVLLPSLGHDREADSPKGRMGATDARGAMALPGMAPRDGASYATLIRRADVQALCALRFLPTVAWGAASLAIPLLVFRHTGSAAATGLYGTVSLIAAAGAQLATGRAIDRETQRNSRSQSEHRSEGPYRLVPPLVGAILMASIGCIVLNGTAVGLFVSGTIWAMAAWALSTTMPPLIHATSAAEDGNRSGGADGARLVGLTHLVWSAGMLMGSFGAGILIAWHSAAPFVLAAVCLVGALWVALPFSRARGTLK